MYLMVISAGGTGVVWPPAHQLQSFDEDTAAISIATAVSTSACMQQCQAFLLYRVSACSHNLKAPEPDVMSIKALVAACAC